jgi:hypothetical protein
MTKQPVHRHGQSGRNRSTSRRRHPSQPTTETSASPEQLKIDKLNADPCITIRRTAEPLRNSRQELISETVEVDLERGIQEC